MDSALAAFLVMDNPRRYFVAVDGNILLVRTESPSDLMEGELVFVEVTGISAGSRVVNPAETLKVPDIYFAWPTANQP